MLLVLESPVLDVLEPPGHIELLPELKEQLLGVEQVLLGVDDRLDGVQVVLLLHEALLLDHGFSYIDRLELTASHIMNSIININTHSHILKEENKTNKKNIII